MSAYMPILFSHLKYCASIQPGSHVIEGSKCTFRVTILQVIGVPQDFTDVFVQFRYARICQDSWHQKRCSRPLRFLHTGSDMSFSTEPLRNEHPDLVLGFYHMENVSGNTHNVSGNTHNVSGKHT